MMWSKGCVVLVLPLAKYGESVLSSEFALRALSLNRACGLFLSNQVEEYLVDDGELECMD